jgi:hypothetical protein
VVDQADDAAPQEPTSYDGISTETYAMWLLHDPVAKMLMQFLRDYRDAAIRDMVAAWENAALDQEHSHDLRGYCRALREITTIRIPEIARFYADATANAKAADEAERAAVNGRSVETD